MTIWRATLIAALLAATSPVLAQAADGGFQGGRGAAMWAGMSDAGQQAMRSAMRGLDARTDRMAVREARDRMLAILDADRLDVAALRRAMEEERSAVTAQQARRQTAMLGAFQQLSAADRKAFVAGARVVRARVEQRATLRAERRSMRDGAPPPQ